MVDLTPKLCRTACGAARFYHTGKVDQALKNFSGGAI